jgi:cytochrome c biogenesis protein
MILQALSLQSTLKTSWLVPSGAGVSIGGLGGYKGTAMVPEGGDFIFSQVLSPQSALSRLPGGANAMLRVNSFDVKYRDDGSTEQFLSDLSVFDWRGVERLRKIISVNDPLRYQVCPMLPCSVL